MRLFLIPAIALLLCSFLSALVAQQPPEILFEFDKTRSAKMITPNAGSEEDIKVEVNKENIGVKIAANGRSSFPGIAITPSRPWNLAKYGYVEAVLTNTSPATAAKPLVIHLRLDNEVKGQSETNNSTMLILKPGESKALKSYFGYSYGKPAYALNPKEITKMIFFTGPSDQEQSFQISLLQAAGQPGEKPETAATPNSPAKP